MNPTPHGSANTCSVTVYGQPRIVFDNNNLTSLLASSLMARAIPRCYIRVTGITTLSVCCELPESAQLSSR